MDYLYGLGWLLTLILLLGGLLGNFLPLLPAVPLLLAGFVLGSWLDDFQRVGWGSLAILFGLGIVAQIVDFVAGAWGANKLGASRQAVWGAMIGALLGIFVGIPGLIFGPFIGAMLGEWLARGDVLRAGQVGLATWLGLAVGTVLKLCLSLLMVGWFGLAYWW